MDDCKFLHCALLDEDSNETLHFTERLPDGRLFTVMSRRKPDYNSLPSTQYIFGRLSDDNGRTWGKPYYLYEWPSRDDTYVPAGFLIDRDGRVHYFALQIDKTGNELSGSIAYVRFDSYRGENPLFSGIPALRRYTGSLNNLIESASGRLVVPFSTYRSESKNFTSSTIYSDDHGVTWNASNDISIRSDENNCESGAVEPVVAEVADGKLVMLIRTVLGYLWYSVSCDCGATWSKAAPTRLPSSNAPADLIGMPDGRIVVFWNNVLGYPYTGIRYSQARQCLHAAVSRDGLKTLCGGRMVVKKTEGDPDDVYNNYPTSALSSGTEILLRTFEVNGKRGSEWSDPLASLVLLNPDFLEEKTVRNNWNEWVCDLPKTDTGILLKPTADGVAHAETSFPYAADGELTVVTSGKLPDGFRLLLSDCYLDRLCFMKNKRQKGYEDVFGTPYTELRPDESGKWEIRWKGDRVALRVNGRELGEARENSSGFNHLTVMFENGGELALTGFEARSLRNGWDTGIRY